MTRRLLLFSGLAMVMGGCAPRDRFYFDETTISKAKREPQTPPPQMRPYEVGGKTYIPAYAEVGEQEEGFASWYGNEFHGKKTASGELYDMNAFTAAHKTLPMNTIVRVTHKVTGESVVVRINDRGPFVDGRIVDLSAAAGRQLGLDRTGTAPVRLEVLGFDGRVAMKSASETEPKERHTLGGLMVQIGAFFQEANATALAQRYKIVDGRYKATVRRYERDGLYRVMLEGFLSEPEARDFIAARKSDLSGAFIVAE